jgi:two-component system sensor histidine kinase/response regulator
VNSIPRWQKIHNRFLKSEMSRSRLLVIAAVLWISVIAASSVWDWLQAEKSLMVVAASGARSFFYKDVVYRSWAAMQGGVYVPPTDKTPPNPYLAHLPDRDVTTTTGKRLTLVNPAYMTRQVHELGLKKYGLRGHITSLKPIRPENAADPWETKALHAFENGAKEMVTVEMIAGQPHLRLMRPLVTQASCLQCHSMQGYKEGEIRGGISVATPLAPYAMAIREQGILLVLVHVLIGGLGLLGLWLGNVFLGNSEKALRQSEGRLSATLRSIGDGVISTDTAGRVTDLNAVAEMLTGWGGDEARGRPVIEVFRIINAQTRAEAENPVARALAEGVAVGLANHTALIARDGTEWQIADSCAPIRSDDGAILGAVLVFRDVTEEYRRREQLRQSEEKLRALNENLSVGVAMISPNMELLAINPMMREWFPEADQDQHPLCYCAFNVPPRGQPCPDCPVQKTLLDGQTHLSERKTATSQGIRFLRLTATAITDPEGTVTAAIEMVEDITARKQAEALWRARLELVEFAAAHTLDELLQKTLDEVGDLTDSPIGFYHFVEADQKTLTLQAWSTRTINEFCSAQGKGAHYGIDQAGVWVDCVNQRKPVIHNDYASLPHKKGLPPGHAPVVRELVVPIMRADRCVAILGVGNKPGDYTDKDVEIVSFLADVAWEVTSRKRQEEALQQSEERLRSITESAQDAIFMMDAQGLITFWNPAATSIFGYSREEALGRNLHDFLAPKRYLEAHRKAFPEFVRTGRGNAVGKTIELAGRRKDGQEIPLSCSLSAISLDGQWHAVGIIRDITAQKQAEADLLQTNQQLEEAIALAHSMTVQAELASIAKSEFLANVSHEVRTPMNGVIGMTGLLLDTELSEEQRHYAEILRASGESMLSVINDILDFSKIEAGKLDLETLDFDLVSLLDDFAATLSVRAYEKGLELLCAVDPEVPALLRGDPGRLRQILTNLTGNAIKFTHQGEVAVRVSLVSRSDTETVLRFAVRDTGIGIPKDKLGLVFDKFTQADASTTRQYGGTGLGLAISKQLAELMGGEVGVASEEGRGSEFWFTARLARQFQGEKSPPPLLADLRGEHVLVVDDNATNREILSVRLTSWGMRPETAPDGPAALQAVYQGLDTGDPFRLALLDMQMPGMDGQTLAGTIRADSRLADLCLVMMTSLGERGDARRFQEIGFAAYLTKPIRHAELFSVLSALLTNGVPCPQPQPIVTRHSVRDQMRLADKTGARILLAEDNITNQQVALGILNKLGLRADAVANGAEVLKALETIPYDLVLMDVQMPVMDGLEATSQIRNPQFPNCNHDIPIIAMTAHALQGDRERFLKAGMNDYISKPVEPQALAQALERWLPQKGQRPKTEGKKAPPLAVQTVFDRAGLMARLMDDENLVRTVIEGFLQDIPQQILTLKRFLEAGDAGAAERQAHTIKGASANVGGEALGQVAGAMEKAAQAGDLAAVAARLPDLEERFAQLKQRMQGEGP